jgi:hypothetical protein
VIAKRRGGAPLALVSLLFVVAMLVLAAPAALADETDSAASLETVTGGESTLCVPLSVVAQLGQDRVYTVPLAPATLSFDLVNGACVHFPITGGLVESSTMLGTVNHSGGLEILKYNESFEIQNKLDVTDVKILAGASLIGNAMGLIPTPAADLTNATHSQDPTTGVIHFEADAKVSALTATVLNTYFNTTVFQADMSLGRVKADIQTAPLL